MTEREYWLGFSLCSGIGPKRFADLLSRFSTAEKAWHASPQDLTSILGPALTAKLISFRESIVLQDYAATIAEGNIWFVTLKDSEYPELLKVSTNPPFVLYGKGNLYSNDTYHQSRNRFIAVVGTRKITSYGRQVTEIIARDLVRSGCCIVSGLAMGVDAVAHQTALGNGGKTIAVLGCGVDCCNPRSNQRLYEEILSNDGCVVSEFPPGHDPTTGSFPSRNRIIAGLSQAVIVTEGAADSGALITANDAFENNRQVFAVPGPITSSLSKGPNSLLQKGAKLITSGADVLNELGITSTRSVKAKEIAGESEDEQKIIDLLQSEELSFDELRKKSLFDTARLNGLLSLMEMKGFLKQSETGEYVLITN